MSRSFAKVALLLSCLAVACGRRDDAPKSEPDAEEADREATAPEAVEKLPTALPQARPSPFTAEYSVGSLDGDDLVSVRLSEEGMTFSLGDREHRVLVRYDAREGELDRVYAALREAAFDRITTSPTRDARREGTSIRIVAGKERHSVSDFGPITPDDAWLSEYDAAAKAVETLLPSPPADGTRSLVVRWDPSMKGHRAAVELVVGSRAKGVAKITGEITGTSADVRVGLGEAPDDPTGAEPQAPIVATLRAGPGKAGATTAKATGTSTDVQLDPKLHAGVLVAFDEESGSPRIRPIPVSDGDEREGAASGREDAAARPAEGAPRAPSKTPPSAP